MKSFEWIGKLNKYKTSTTKEKKKMIYNKRMISCIVIHTDKGGNVCEYLLLHTYGGTSNRHYFISNKV